MKLKATPIGIALVALLTFCHRIDAAQVSFSTNAPTLGPDDIGNFAGAAVVGNNVASGDPNATYIAYDRPIQGQVFTTGANPAGYQLRAVTLRQVTYFTYARVPDLTYTIRVTTPLASPPNRLAVVATETAVTAGATNNFPTIDDGNSQGPGSGSYVTFTLENPVALTPNTSYGFDIGAGSTSHYWECDGTSSNPYVGGYAYSSGAAGVGNTTRTPRTGDHVFAVKLTRPSSPVVSVPFVSPSTNVFAGTPVTMSIGAAGSPPLHYQWQWDDGFGSDLIAFNIAGANSTNLVVDTTSLTGTYYYHVIVTNSLGATTSAPVRLTVSAANAPILRTDTTPSVATRYVGQEVTFIAEFDGTPPIYYQWLKFGDPIPNATNTTLTLSNLQLSDSDPYSLFASNFVGTATSAFAELTILTPPAPPAPGTYTHAALTNSPIAYWRLNDPAGTQVIYESIANHNAANSAVTLGVSGLRSPDYPGFPADNTAGSFSGSAATTDASLNGFTNFSVIGWFNPSGPNGPFSGLFGQNDLLEVGYSDGAGVNLWVQLDGIWQNPRTGTNGFEVGEWYFVAIVANGSAVDIYVNGVLRTHHTGGMPTATSTSGFNIGGGGIFGSSGDNFNGLIEDVGIFDRSLSAMQIQELYYFAAGSGVPSILVQPRSQTLHPGRVARFAASGISGSPPLTFQWIFNGGELADGGNISGAVTSSLTISNVSPAEAGSYQLHISNDAGSVASSTVTLTLVEPTGTQYESAAIDLEPLAYWRLNESDNPSSGSAIAHDYIGGFAGTYGVSAQNGFQSIAGPLAADGFDAFEITNTALQSARNVDQSWVTVPALDLNTNTASFTMWIKPNGSQTDYTGVFMTRSGTEAGLGYGGAFSGNAGQLIYTWNNDSTWIFQSGLTIPENQWSFAAVVIDPAKAILYLYNTNGLRSATNLVPHIVEAWAGSGRIGGDTGGIERTFNGVIDEVAVFNYALSPAQILGLYNGTITLPPVSLGIQRSGNDLILSWQQGTLQGATNLFGPWSAVNGASAPSHTVDSSGPQKFYRVRVSP